MHPLEPNEDMLATASEDTSAQIIDNTTGKFVHSGVASDGSKIPSDGIHVDEAMSAYFITKKVEHKLLREKQLKVLYQLERNKYI